MRRPPDASSVLGSAESQATATLVAAPITHTLLTAGTNPTNTTVYTTASISPAPNTLVTLAVLSQRSYGASVAPTVTGGGMTAWAQVASVTFDPLSVPLRRLTIYRAMSPAPQIGLPHRGIGAPLPGEHAPTRPERRAQPVHGETGSSHSRDP
ncbi:MAG: hypothetical protein ACREMW_10285 [Gemmatimonadales bacterium]